MIRPGIIPLLLILFMALPSCETAPEEEIRCYPQKVTRKIADGTIITEIIADYRYEGDRLDYIIMSNFQTHYYSYNENGRLESVSRKQVKEFRTLLSKLTYDGGLVSKCDEYLVRLDPVTQEAIDTTLQGYREFFYDGDRLTGEDEYRMNEDTREMELVTEKTYTLDANGNILEYLELDGMTGDTLAAGTYTYDSQHHPFSDLELLFEGGSHENNILRHTDHMSGDEYVHQIVYTKAMYPEQVIIRRNGNFNSEVISYTYACR